MDDEAIQQEGVFAEEGQPENTTPFQAILYCVLLLLIGATTYDLVVARREWNGAIERLNVKIRGPQGGGAVIRVDPSTREQVTELIGRPPSETTEGPSYYLDHYRWRRGVPWRYYELYAIFSKGTIPLLHDISYPGPPDGSKLPRGDAFAPVEPPGS
ncbi:MAG: hypothetical protein ACC645_10415 [Pirellulales bacterium]